MNLVQLAGVLPRNPEFREWVRRHNVPIHLVNEDGAAWFIRNVCGIESRRDLATNEVAQKLFHNLIRLPFTEWRDKQHQQQGVTA